MNVSDKSDENSKTNEATGIDILNVNSKLGTPLIRECNWGQLRIDTFIYYDVAGGGLNKIWDSLVDEQEHLFAQAGLKMDKMPSFSSEEGIPTLLKFYVTFGVFVFGLSATLFFLDINSETDIIILSISSIININILYFTK